MRNLVPSTLLSTVGRMASDEVAPAAPTMNSWANRSAGVFTGAVCQRTQTRAGREGAPSQFLRRGGAGAQPVHAPRIDLDIGLRGERVVDNIARERAQHCAVARRLGIKVI